MSVSFSILAWSLAIYLGLGAVMILAYARPICKYFATRPRPFVSAFQFTLYLGCCWGMGAAVRLREILKTLQAQQTEEDTDRAMKLADCAWKILSEHCKKSLTEPLDISFKKLCPSAVIPLAATKGSGGYDLTVTETIRHDVSRILEVRFGIAVAIPDGHVGLLFPRSSVCRYPLSLTNCVGVIDSDYRGEISAKFRIVADGPMYQPGDRAVQMIPISVREIRWTEKDELTITRRGAGGFGSTGK